MFHVSQLKKKIGQRVQVQHHPLVLTRQFELQVIRKEVIGIRWNGELVANKWLVKWKGMSDSEATWESLHLIQ